MAHKIEKDWVTGVGLRAVVLVIEFYEGQPHHRCGYVEVPQGHPLYGVEYGQDTEVLAEAHKKALEGPIGKRGPISILCATEDRRSPETAFDVHGSLTYSGGSGKYPVESTGWWFGFDAAHAGDRNIGEQDYWDHTATVKTLDYMARECESLATQISQAVTQ